MFSRTETYSIRLSIHGEQSSALTLDPSSVEDAIADTSVEQAILSNLKWQKMNNGKDDVSVTIKVLIETCGKQKSASLPVSYQNPGMLNGSMSFADYFQFICCTSVEATFH